MGPLSPHGFLAGLSVIWISPKIDPPDPKCRSKNRLHRIIFSPVFDICENSYSQPPHLYIDGKYAIIFLSLLDIIKNRHPPTATIYNTSQNIKQSFKTALDISRDRSSDSFRAVLRNILPYMPVSYMGAQAAFYEC